MRKYSPSNGPTLTVSRVSSRSSNTLRSPKTVFTDGVFDMLHANHVSFLEDAKNYGDRLVVGVVSDTQAKSFKRMPVINQTERLRMVSALACVDEAFIIEVPLVAKTMEQIIWKYSVEAVVYSGDGTPDFYSPAEKAHIMHRLSYREGINTTKIIARVIAMNKAGEL